MKESCGIYRITNKVTGKSYVGQARNAFSRWYEHLYRSFELERTDYETPLHLAFRKYGISSFSFEILEVCSREELNSKEIAWIEKLNTLAPNGYNLCVGGHQKWEVHMCARKNNCPMCGNQKSINAKLCRNCENKTRGVWWQKMDKIDVAKRIYGGETTKDFAKEIGISMKAIRKGFRKMGLPQKAREIKKWYMEFAGIKEPEKSTPTNLPKPIIMMSESQQEIRRFSSVGEAGRYLGCSGEVIRHALVRGKSHKSKGFYWKYAPIV